MLNIINKKISYLKSTSLIKLFRLNKNNFCLICHLNFIDSFDYKLIDDFCKINNIDYYNFPNYLFKKLSWNSYIDYTFSGPTVIIFFKDIDNYLNFFSQKIIKNKFISFIFIYKGLLYKCDTLEKYIKKNNLIKYTKLDLQKIFIKNLNNNFINNLKFIINKK